MASDVCRALGLPTGGTAGGATLYLGRLHADEKRTVRRAEAICSPQLFGANAPALTLVSEPGLYKVTLRSDKPEALAFHDWVTREVLPSIRKTGSYALADHGRTEMPIPAEFLQVFREALLAAPFYRGRTPVVGVPGGCAAQRRAATE